MERRVDMAAPGLASLTLVQAIIEKLIDTSALTFDSVHQAFQQSIDVHLDAAQRIHGHQSADAAYLLKEVLDDIRREYGPGVP